jgi:hypothetical protein
MRLFEVEAKCGHVGRNYFTLKIFPIEAETRKEAAAMVRNMPRVKHHHKDAIRRVDEISPERYEELRNKNNCDPYFSCTNIQEQRRNIAEIELFEEEKKIVEEEKKIVKDREQIKKPICIGKKLLRNPKRYITHYYLEKTRFAI